MTISRGSLPKCGSIHLTSEAHGTPGIFLEFESRIYCGRPGI
jgi:hypothetical protein